MAIISNFPGGKKLSAWTTPPTPPGSFYPYNPNIIGSKIIFSGNTSGTAPLQIYDINTNTWASSPTAPGNYYYYKANIIGSKIIFAGSSSTTINPLRIYDIDTNTWASSPVPLGYGYNYSYSQAIGSIIYFISTDNSGYRAYLMYNVNTNNFAMYSTSSSMGMSAAGELRIGSKLVSLLDGEISSSPLLIFDIGNCLFSTSPNPPGTIHINSAQIIGADIVFNSDMNYSTNSLRIYNIGNNIWRSSPAAPFAIAGYNVQSIGSKIIYSPQNPDQPLCIYDLSANTWSTPPVPNADYNDFYNGKIIGSKFYVVDGMLPGVDIFNISTNSYTKSSISPNYPSSTGSQLIGSRIVFPPNSYPNGVNPVNTYDTSRNTWLTSPPPPGAIGYNTLLIGSKIIFYTENNTIPFYIYNLDIDIANNT